MPKKTTRVVRTKKAAAKPPKKAARRAAKPVDLFRDRPEFFRAGRTPELVKLGPAKYLAVEGRGQPGGPAFQAAVQSLYHVAYTMKFQRKAEGAPDFKVSTLEGQWWFDETARPKDARRPWSVSPKDWRWKLLVMVPDFIGKADVAKAKCDCSDRHCDAKADTVALESIREGLCVQMLHVGPYDDEPESIARMHVAATSEGFSPSGRHHEIYMSDPRRSKPQRLRTILRQPVRKARG